MMTSRSEYRLLLRQDNADMRLTPIGREVGLIGDERWEKFLKKCELVRGEISRIESTVVSPTVANPLLVSLGSAQIKSGITLGELLRRPEIGYASLAPIDTGRPELPPGVIYTAEISIKYEGYIKRQMAEVKRRRALEERRLPLDIDYSKILGLRAEAVEKLGKIRPTNIGQASRISGVSPADISVLLIYLSSH
jgi:tRNA uridine 5-carboxymethylaminomethyl modification enzyme